LATGKHFIVSINDAETALGELLAIDAVTRAAHQLGRLDPGHPAQYAEASALGERASTKSDTVEETEKRRG
jgi:hypothetical protein